MKVTFYIQQTFTVVELRIEAKVRYWEDATVNGIEDTDGSLIPCREGELWKPIIHIDSGRIINWEQGKTAEIHYKVCDEGKYGLYDDNGKIVREIEGYVPEALAIEDSGYGDYIIINVNENGIINEWDPESISYMIKEDD